MKFVTDMPEIGTVRKRTEFLLMPLTISKTPAIGQAAHVTRWLETASWEEEFIRTRTGYVWAKRRWLTT